MNLCSDNQHISNSPSKIRGGRGALNYRMICYLSASYSSGAPRHLPYLRGGAEYQHFIFIELTLFTVFVNIGGTKDERVGIQPQDVVGYGHIVTHNPLYNQVFINPATRKSPTPWTGTRDLSNLWRRFNATSYRSADNQ